MLRHVHLESCDSTQDELERRLEAGLPPADDLIVSTGNQRQGRGRHDRTWEFLPGSLAFSFTVRPHPRLSWQSLEVAVALADFLETRFGVHVGLKWPNDVLADGKKCGGILLKHMDGRVVVGVGLNLLPAPASSWGHVLSEATALPEGWALKLPEEFVYAYLASTPSPVAVLRRGWEHRCVHMARTVRVSENGLEVSGVFKCIGDDGEAVLETGGAERHLYNGTLRWE